MSSQSIIAKIFNHFIFNNLLFSMNSSNISPNNIDDGQCYINTIIGLSALELLLHPIASLISLFNFAILFQTNLLHPNLKCILLFQSCTIFISEMCREIYVIFKFIDGNFSGLQYFIPVAIASIAFFVNTFRDFLCHVLLKERAFATIFYRKYSQFKKMHANLWWILGLTLVSIWTVWSQNGTQKTINNLAIFRIYFGIFTGLAEILAMFYIYSFNKRKYQNEIANALNHRFQRSENIRTARQLGPTFVLQFFNFLINNSSTLLIYFGLLQNEYTIGLGFVIICLLNGLINILVELTVITHHPLLKRKAYQMICGIGIIKRGRNGAIIHDIRQQPKMENNSPKNINGQQLITNSEQDAYFRMLKESWN